MTLKLLAVATAWALSLLGVAVWAQSGTPQQEISPEAIREIRESIKEGAPTGGIVTGENIGFQRVLTSVERSGTVTGKLMVRVNGTWLEAQFATMTGTAR